jgi:hypothetical protein
MKRFISLLAGVWILVWPAQEIKAQWVDTKGPNANSVFSFAVSPDGGGTGGTNLFAGTALGVFLSTNNGTIWTAVNTGLTNRFVSGLAVCGTNLFAGTLGGGVFLSTNNGTSWTAVNTGLTNRIAGGFAVSGTNLFVGTSGGVFLSTNNGASWTAVNTGLTRWGVSDFAVSGTNVFVGNDSGVFRSTNDGTSWTAVNTGLTNTNVTAFAVSGTNLFAGTNGGGVFLSTNNGTSWTAVNIGLTISYVYALAVSGTNLFAGTSLTGVFLSTNNGTSWTAVNTGLPRYLNLIAPLVVSGSYLFAGTSFSVWRRPLSEMITAVEQISGDGLPKGFALEQNYPNPFNPSTTIRFSLPKSGHVTLKVYDLLGREVETLVDDQRTAGSYSVEWTPNNLASGVYFYRIQAGAYTETKKLMLLR